MNIQSYLSTHTLQQLEEQYGVKAKRHETLPLVILNYSQTDSPKMHPIVRECRGLVLELRTWNVVGRSFKRFFNWGETDEWKSFCFNGCEATSKEDGSLITVFNYRGQWLMSTKGSFGDGAVGHANCTWRQEVERLLPAIKNNDLNTRLDADFSYVFEYCGPYNKIVRTYSEPKLYLLTAVCNEGGGEACDAYVKDFSRLNNVEIPTSYTFNRIEEVQAFLQTNGESDPTFEGVVLRDVNGLRCKVKSPTYLGLHHMRGNNNVYNPKHLLPFVLSGEADELLTYFPECETVYREVEEIVEKAYTNLYCLWLDNWQIADQKQFALSVAGKPFCGILFLIRKKYGDQQTCQLLDEEWRRHGPLIVRTLL